MIEKIVLQNGVRILAERIDHVRSASVGIWVGSGSRHEPQSKNGISHFIEHMVFKGTSTRSASDIAAEMDGIGGQVNAFTTKECTCFYARALDSHLSIAVDVLCDMLLNSKMDDADVSNELGVILEEIDMYEDTPDDLVMERLFQEVYRGTQLGQPVIGCYDTLKEMRGADLSEYMHNNYSPQCIVVAISGSFSSSDIELIKEKFAGLKQTPAPVQRPASYNIGFTVCQKPIEQNHLCIAFPSIPAASDDRHALKVFSAILGGGMSSRLFQSVREEHGLCYSIYTYTVAHNDTGVFGIYLALGSDTEENALKLTRDVVRRFYIDGPTVSELERAREQLKANVLMSMESMTTRMNHIARSEMLIGRIPSQDEIIESYNLVTRDRVMSLAREILQFDKTSFSAVGSVKTAEQYAELIM